MSLTSSINDHFIIWPSSVTLTFNLRKPIFWTALLLLKDNNCAKLFWNPCINVPVMARTSSIYDHFELYLTPMSLTFNLPEKMFQMALLLLKDNNCAKLFWNSCMNYKLWPRQAQYMTILTFIWPLWPWPSTYLKKCFKWHFSSSRATTVQNYFIIHAYMYKLCSGQAQYMFMTILTFIWPLWPWPSTYLKYVSKGTSPPQGQQLCQIVLKSMHYYTSYGPENPDGRTDAHTYTELKL